MVLFFLKCSKTMKVISFFLFTKKSTKITSLRLALAALFYVSYLRSYGHLFLLGGLDFKNSNFYSLAGKYFN